MPGLNPTAASLLGFLHAGPQTGWDLVATATGRLGGFWSLTRSQVYRELAALARDGLVEAGAKGARDKQPYTLTAAGRTAFADWVRRPPADESVRVPVLLTVAFGAHLDRATLDALLAERRGHHEARLARHLARREAVAAADPWARATLEFGIRHEQAVLDWFETLPDLLPPAGTTPPVSPGG